jgi:hypothetical protein
MLLYRERQFCQGNQKLWCGNDTIDCYPLQHCGEIQKILCVSEKTFKTIVKEFEAFFKGVSGQLSPRSFGVEPYKGQNTGLKPAPQTISAKLGLTTKAEYVRDYEPSNTIYLQYSEIRRWRRVNEWFNQYAHTVQ